jgi:hypothetical protein
VRSGKPGGVCGESSSSSYLWFGDATGGLNAKAELTQFAFTQPAAEDLVGSTITLNFSETLDAASVQGTLGVWRYGGHTYTLTPRSMSWTEAGADAPRLGGHLVTINDAAEQAWVSETFGGWGGWYVWLGMNRTASGMTWASGQPVSYTNWGPNQPSGYSYSYMGWDGRWYNTDETVPASLPAAASNPAVDVIRQLASGALSKPADTPAAPVRLDLSGSYTGFSFPADRHPAKSDWRQAFVTNLAIPPAIPAGPNAALRITLPPRLETTRQEEQL